MSNPLVVIAATIIATSPKAPRKAIRKEEPKPVVPWYRRLAFWWDGLWR
jgi:hypothetical protein